MYFVKDKVYKGHQICEVVSVVAKDDDWRVEVKILGRDPPKYEWLSQADDIDDLCTAGPNHPSRQKK